MEELKEKCGCGCEKCQDAEASIQSVPDEKSLGDLAPYQVSGFEYIETGVNTTMGVTGDRWGSSKVYGVTGGRYGSSKVSEYYGADGVSLAGLSIDPKLLEEAAQKQAQKSGSKLNTEQVSSLVQKAAELFRKSDFVREVEASCGKKPGALASRAKKDEWQKCAQEYALNKARSLAQSYNSSKADSSTVSPEPKGLSTGAKVGIAVAAVAVLSIGFYFIAKKK